MSSAAIVSKVTGAAFVIRGGKEIAASQGMELEVSDSIRTGMNGQCELRFADDTEVELSPMSQVQIQDFAFNPETPAANSFAMHMMEGLVRTVSGEVVKLNPEGFALSTPLGTAGIRGTTVIAQVFPTHVVFMVTEMGAGNTVVINSVFGGELTILMPGQGAELSLTGQQRITLIDSMPEHMRDAVRDFFENQYDDLRSSHDSILLFGDIEFLAALGAENVGRGVGMLSAESEEILIQLLQELGVEQPEFFLEGPPQRSSPDYIVFLGDDGDNTLAPMAELFGDDFKNLNYDIRGFAGEDKIVAFNGTDTVYGGQGNGYDVIQKISPAITAGNLLVGGNATLKGVGLLDGDQIILRSLGQSPDTTDGWIINNPALYGATVMSGGSVVGSAVDLSGSFGGGNYINLYGTMTGGAIYGSAVNSANNTLSGNDIYISKGQDTDGAPIGGLLDGGTIYGDAHNITGGRAGSDSITLEDMKSGDIYGDAATGSGYTPGENTITVNNTMSGGTIHAGNGDDQIKVGVFGAGAVIDAGAGDDSIKISTAAGGTIKPGAGADTIYANTNGSGSLTIDGLAGTLDLHADSKKITLTNYDDGILILDELTGSNTIAADSPTIMTMDPMSSDLILTGGGKLLIDGWSGGSLDYSGITAATVITVSQETLIGLDISGANGSRGAAININANSMAGEIIGSAGADVITIGRFGADSGAVAMGSTTIDCGGGPDVISIEGSMFNGTINLGDSGAGTNKVEINGRMMGSAEIHGGSGSDSIEITEEMMGNSKISTGAGNDHIEVFKMTENSKIETGVGNDYIKVSANKDGGTIDCGAGDDVLVIEGTWASADTIILGAGADSVKLHSIGDVANGTAYLDLGANDGGVDTVDLRDLSAVASGGYNLVIKNAESVDKLLLPDFVSLVDDCIGVGQFQFSVGGNTFTVSCLDSGGMAINVKYLP